MFFRPNRAVTKRYPLMTVAKEPGHRGARRKPLKPLRAGMPGDSGVLVVTRVRSITTKCARGRGCSGHPAFPTPSKGAEDLGRIAPRDRERVFAIVVIARSPCDEAIHSLCGEMNCFAEPVIGRAFARPVGSQRRFGRSIGNSAAAAPLGYCGWMPASRVLRDCPGFHTSLR
jgi:hypothetical protein